MIGAWWKCGECEDEERVEMGWGVWRCRGEQCGGEEIMGEPGMIPGLPGPRGGGGMG